MRKGRRFLWGIGGGKLAASHQAPFRGVKALATPLPFYLVTIKPQYDGHSNK